MAWATVTSPTTATPVSTSTFGTPVAGNMAILAGAWTTYTPTLTSLSTGNGTLSARWLSVGKTVDFSVVLTLGSTSSIGSGPQLTLPSAPLAARLVFTGTAFDSSANTDFALYGALTASSTITLRTSPTTAGNGLPNVTSTVPFTWATGDVISITGRYEAA